jgi:hypothetical protein
MLKKALIIGIVAAFVVTVGAIAYASIPGPDGVIHGCYKTTNPAQGSLIAIDSAATCPSGFAALNWNQTGPQGPAGAPGISNYEVVNNHIITDFHPGASYLVSATCPAGKKVLGGGYEGNESVKVIWDRPGGGTNNDAGWFSELIPLASFSSFDMWAICATVAT